MALGIQCSEVMVKEVGDKARLPTDLPVHLVHPAVPRVSQAQAHLLDRNEEGCGEDQIMCERPHG